MTEAEIDDFLAQEVVAVAGVSRHGRGYGHKVWQNLKARGVRVYLLNPGATTIGGEPAYARVTDLPEPVGGVVTVVPPEWTVEIVRDCIEAGVPRVWMQPGSESEEAIALARDHGLDVISGACIMMS